MQKIILASGSERRKEILGLLGLRFEVKESGFDESIVRCEEAEELVEELALQKALAVVREEPDALVVGGDTVVVVAGEILGKAENEEEAREILEKLIGRRHSVVTGVAVVNSLTGERAVGHEAGGVWFREVNEAELAKYLKAGHWRGFAGCYAIQGGAKSWVREQTGSLSAIIGMPITLTVQLLEEMGVVVEVDPKKVEERLQGMKVGVKD